MTEGRADRAAPLLDFVNACLAATNATAEAWRAAVVQQIRPGIDQLLQQVADQAASLSALQQYLRDIAAALQLPPEAVDLPTCQHVLVGHAKAAYDGLVVTQRALENAKEEIQRLKEDRHEFRELYDEAKIDLEEAEAEVTALRDQLAELRTDKSFHQLMTHSEQLQEARDEVAALRDQLVQAEKERDQWRQDFKTSNAALANAQDKLLKKERKIASLEDEQARLKDELSHPQHFSESEVIRAVTARAEGAEADWREEERRADRLQAGLTAAVHTLETERAALGPLQWQPIESAPKDDEPILVAFVETGIRKRPRKPYIGEAEFRDGGWWWPNDYDDGWIQPQPTHWLPLSPLLDTLLRSRVPPETEG